MAFEQKSVGKVHVLRPRGRLDSANAAELEKAVKDLFETGCTCLLFNMSDLDHISSAGLRVLLEAGKGVRAAQGRLVLCGARGSVREMIKMSGFFTLFPAADDEPAGLALFEP